MSSRTVVIFGSNGALGRAISKRFGDTSWRSVLCDVADISCMDNYVNLSAGVTAKEQYKLVEKKLADLSIIPSSVTAVVNVGGGFRMEKINVCSITHLN